MEWHHAQRHIVLRRLPHFHPVRVPVACEREKILEGPKVLLQRFSCRADLPGTNGVIDAGFHARDRLNKFGEGHGENVGDEAGRFDPHLARVT